MVETLFIRLGSRAEDTITWLIFSDNEQEIIASGELNNAEQLSELTEKSKQRKVQVFVPSCDVALKSLTVPGNSQRAIRAAAPYMLEDDLSQDVENLFFAYAHLPTDEHGNNCFVAGVEHNQMKLWLQWLASADIRCKEMLPDVLAMPLTDNKWSAVTIGDLPQQQVIVRQGKWQGFTVDTQAWQVIVGQWQDKIENQQDSDDNDIKVINAYSELTLPAQVTALKIDPMPEELPLALLAQHGNFSMFNLLQGEFKVKEKRSQSIIYWQIAAGVAFFALLLNMGIKSAELHQLSLQQQQVEDQIIAVYKKTFPKTKRVRISTIKSQLNRKLTELGGGSGGEGFLTMLTTIEPAFAKVPQLKPQSLKFDGKRQELRLQAKAKSYQHFDQFSNALESLGLTVKQGAQNNQTDHVTGSFSITKKQSGKSRSTKNKTRGRS